MCSDQPIPSVDNQVKVVFLSLMTIVASFFESKHCDAFVLTKIRTDCKTQIIKGVSQGQLNKSIAKNLSPS